MSIFKRKITAISLPVKWKTKENHELDQSIDYDKLGLTPPKESERDTEIENMLISLASIATINENYEGLSVLRTMDGSSFNIALPFEVIESLLTKCGWNIFEIKIK